MPLNALGTLFLEILREFLEALDARGLRASGFRGRDFFDRAVRNTRGAGDMWPIAFGCLEVVENVAVKGFHGIWSLGPYLGFYKSNVGPDSV
jgi:hypothetical protein